MEDEELGRARRALREVDPEIDLHRVYAESRARAHAADADPAGTHAALPHGETVEILLHGPGSGTWHDGAAARRGRAFLWAAVASAAAAAAVALVVSVANLPPPRTLPGGVPTASTPASTDPSSAPRPSPSFGSTPAEVVLQTAEAVARARCGVETRSTLGEESKARFDDPRTRNPATPTPTRVDQAPLQVLQLVTSEAVLGLSDGADHGLQDDLTLEQVAGEITVRIRFSPPDGLVAGGDVTRIDLLVDPSTWLPHAGETWAESDGGKEYFLHSEFRWTSCGEAGSSTSDGAGRP